MCAVIVKGGAVLSVGINRNYNHAERRAIRPHVDYSGSTIYVMRHNGRISRPCVDCQRIILEAGIGRAVFIGADNRTEVTETF